MSTHLLLVQAVAEEVAMTELRRANHDGGENRPDHQGEEREGSLPGVGSAAAAQGTAARDRLALSGADLAAQRQARALWSGLLEPEHAGGMSEAELGRAWTVAQCWRDVDPEAERAAEPAEHQLWNRRPDVMQRYDCLTAVGSDPIEATLRVAPSLDQPASASGHKIERPDTGSRSGAATESSDHWVTVGRLLSRHLPQPITVHDLTAPSASTPVVAPTSLTLNTTAGPRRQA